MPLETLSQLAEVVGVLVVLAGFIFAAIQVGQFSRQRSDRSAIELARTWHNPEFGHAMRVVLELPPGATAEAVRGETSVADAAMLVAVTLESVGVMVHRRIVRTDLVWELAGGVILASWDRLENWIKAVRDEQENEKFAEWNEWLADQLRRFQTDAKPPAHQRYRDWNP